MSVNLGIRQGCASTYLWRGLWVIISPGCGVSGGRRSSGDDRYGGSTVGREGLRWRLYLDPLLGSSQVIACVPLVLCGGIRSSVTDISIWDCAVNSSLVWLSIRQSIVCAGINLGQASVGNGRISLNGFGGLDRLSLGLGLGSRLVEGSRVGGN